MKSANLLIPFLALLTLYSCSTKPTLVIPDNLSKEFENEMELVNSYIDYYQYDSAEAHLLAYYPKLTTPHEKAVHFCIQARIMFHNNLNNLAKDNISKAEELSKNVNNKYLSAHIYTLKGIYFRRTEQYDSALYYYKHALGKVEPLVTHPIYCEYYYIASKMGAAYLGSEKLDSAIYYAQLSNRTLPKKGPHYYYAINYGIIGNALLKQKKYNEAKNYFEMGLSHSKEHIQVAHSLFIGLIEISKIERNKDEFNKWVNLGIELQKQQLVSLTNLQKFSNSVLDNTELFYSLENYTNTIKMLDRYYSKAIEVESNHQIDVLTRYYQELENTNKIIELDKQKQHQIAQFRYSIFIVVIIFILITSLVLYSRSRIKQEYLLSKIEIQKKINALEQEKIVAKQKAIETERSRMSRELHDDIGSSMSSLKIYLRLALKEVNLKIEKTEDLIRKSLNEITIIEENLGDLIWAVYSYKSNFENLVLRMKQYAFDTLAAKEIESTFIHPEDLLAIKIPIDYTKNILLMFKEFVNNTAKYSDATKFHFEVIKEGDILTLIFEENGKGFDPDGIQYGKGVQNMRLRSEAMNAQLSFKTSPGEGTRVELIIPIPPVEID